MSTTGSARVMTPAQFIAKWSPVTLSERAASRERFIDLARLLPQATPTVLLRRRSSVVVHHVANVNVVGSNLIARFDGHQWTAVPWWPFSCPIVPPSREIQTPLQTRPFALSCPLVDRRALQRPAFRHRVGHRWSPRRSLALAALSARQCRETLQWSCFPPLVRQPC